LKNTFQIWTKWLSLKISSSKTHIRNFEVIGEASNNIEKRFPEFVTSHPELPLASAYQMRNAVAHGYFKVDFEILWKTIQRELPSFYAKVQGVREKLALGN